MAKRPRRTPIEFQLQALLDHFNGKPNELEPHERQLVAFISEMRDLVKTLRPGADKPFKMTVNAVPIPVPLSEKETLGWMRAALDGKPVPFTVDFHDGSSPVTVKLPLSNRRRPIDSIRVSGRPRHPLTVKRTQREARRGGTASEIAQRLTVALRREFGEEIKPVTAKIVRLRLKEGQTRPHPAK